ncbi:MAG: hypothetical protein GQ529_09665 [Methyloprofundus sp.]|nr:hypothetical protein [Methyloprofundus sp.]
MYKCKEIIELTSQNMDSSLSWYIRLELKAHYLMCKTCHRYAQQLQFMNRALEAFEGHGPINNCQLSDNVKQRIAEKMRQAKETIEQ